MLYDLTLKITREMRITAEGNEKKALSGHLGTHFDVMDKDFPLEYTRRKGICFDIRDLEEVDLSDVDLMQIEPGMFVAFYSGYIDAVGYGSSTYFKEHPQLSLSLIDALLEKKVSIIGVDFAGIRRGKEHTPMDQKCAEQGTFVVENLCGLEKICGQRFVAHTYPLNYEDMSGLPCRVVAEI